MTEYERLKLHFKKNKNAYVVGGTCLVVGLAVGLSFATGQKAAVAQVKNGARIFSKGDNISQFIMTPLGHPGNVVQCVETGTTFASQGELARSLGISATAVGKHLHGKLPNLFGKTYQVIGTAGQPIAS